MWIELVAIPITVFVSFLCALASREKEHNLRIETTDGLRFFIAFYPSYDWIYGTGTLSYYQMDDQMHDWINRNLDK